ncbi:MAG TPA: type II CAAX endopeptidase family protein [Candidatus Acidoferrum sp.]|nr:type II CAAX endopeptidase family protein [Candidatus Acidoferrum sp.]
MDEQQGGVVQPFQEPKKPATNLFLNQEGLRPGWRLLIYIVMVVAVSTAINLLIHILFHPKQTGFNDGWSMLWQELGGFTVVFGCALIMALIEKRSAGRYGLPASEILGKKFWLGFLIGLIQVSLLVWLISAFGGYTFGTIALDRAGILKMGLLYFVGFTFVGLFEEFLFRGYTQYTLGEGIGFWPAAILLSVLFGGVHLMNPGEGIVGAASVVMVALYFCFTLKRTGNLWFAVGFHASFDWGETFLYSVPNSGLVMQGHLSNAVLKAGPKWLTGGTIGPEGSVFCFLTIALQFLLVMWMFPAKKSETLAQQPALQS